MPRVIAFAGLKESGKSSAAKVLIAKHGFKIVKFADKLKEMLKVLGLTPEELEGPRKGLPCKALNGRSPRYAFTTLGTDWGRQMISEDLWAMHWKNAAKQWLLDGHPVVCDDVRYANEVKVVRDLGGEVWAIQRQGVQQSGHSSESGEAIRLSDHRIRNDGTLSDLAFAVEDLFGRT